MSSPARDASPARITRNARTAETLVEEMGVFESIPALPFLVAMLVGEVHTRLPRPLGRLLCREVHRITRRLRPRTHRHRAGHTEDHPTLTLCTHHTRCTYSVSMVPDT